MAKILLIDDDPDVRQVIGAALKREGYAVETASRKEEALEKIAQEKPSLILLDVLLSGADGRELCRQLKADENTRPIPVIMLSGHPVAAVQYASYGAEDFIAKPFSTDTLLKKLAERMSKSK
jgi:CheY-like chemotaxis protein